MDQMESSADLAVNGVSASTGPLTSTVLPIALGATNSHDLTSIDHSIKPYQIYQYYNTKQSKLQLNYMINTALKLSLRFLSKRATPKFFISNWKMPAFEIDTAGISGFLESRNEAYLTASQKFSEIGFSNLYHGLDEWSR